MSIRTLGMPEQLYEYYLNTMVQEAPILGTLRQATAGLPLAAMQISPEQGQLLQFLMRLINARKTLDIGTFTGYSALSVALALPEDGQVIACDVNEEWTHLAQAHWQKAGVAHKIELRLAPALDTLNELIAAGLANSFDFAFIDADKANYDHYYEKSLQLIRVNGLIAIDNVFWDGKVADCAVHDTRTQAIRTLNTKIKTDQRVIAVTVPIGDGCTLVYKK